MTSLVIALAKALDQQLYSFTSGTRTSVCFHGDLDAFTAHCKGPLCLKMPLKHNRSQQVMPAQKINQQGTEFFIYLLFFPSLCHDLNTMGGQYITRKETLHLKQQFWCVNLTLQQYVICSMSRRKQHDHLFWKTRVYEVLEQVTCSDSWVF